MTRDLIPEYFPDKCVGCPVLGEAISARDEAVSNIRLSPSRGEILLATKLRNIARILCESAEANCDGLAWGCMYETPPTE